MNTNNISRRTFIKTASKAGVISAGASFFLANGLFAQGKEAANSKINIGVIGLGKMAKGHIGNLLSYQLCRVTAICDVDDERLAYCKDFIEKGYEKKLGTPQDNTVKTFKDFRKLLEDKSIDAVFIVTPDHWHAIISIMAARAGKAIYCEKPMTFTVEEGQQVVKAVKENGVVFQTGSQQRSESGFRWYAQMIQSGMIGTVKELYCSFGRRYPLMLNFAEDPLPKGIDWDMWVGPAPYRPYSKSLLLPLMTSNKPDLPPEPYGGPWGEWRWHSEYGNGLQADWGAHHIDITMWALKMDGKGPKYVELLSKQNPAYPADKFDIRYTFENGLRLNYGHPGGLQENEKLMVTAVGTEATIGASRGAKRYSSKPSLLTARIPMDSVPVETSTDHKMNFFKAILENKPTICPAEVGASSCNACLIGNIAHKLGRSLEWDWQMQKFVGDEIANGYLGRANRGEWAKI